MSDTNYPIMRSGFAVGVTPCIDHHPKDPGRYRLVIGVRVGQLSPTQMIVDTGAPWCVLDPELAEQANLPLEDQDLLKERLLLRGDRYEGWLVRTPITLVAEAGDPLEVDSTVFVPKLDEGVVWRHPNFLGLSGFLERLQFALDPVRGHFFFGPCL